MHKFRCILHPTDFSDLSRPAFELACSLARDHGARLTILHVYPPAVTNGELIGYPLGTVLGDEFRRELEKLRPADSAVGVEHMLLMGDPAVTIVDIADELPADLIVMGTHGRTGLRRLLAGSVAEHVVRKALCPVVTMRAPLPITARPEAAGDSCCARTSETSELGAACFER